MEIKKKKDQISFIPGVSPPLFSVICLTYMSLQGFESTSVTILSNISINIRRNLLYLKIFTDTRLNFYLLFIASQKTSQGWMRKVLVSSKLSRLSPQYPGKIMLHFKLIKWERVNAWNKIIEWRGAFLIQQSMGLAHFRHSMLRTPR